VVPSEPVVAPMQRICSRQLALPGANPRASTRSTTGSDTGNKAWFSVRSRRTSFSRASLCDEKKKGQGEIKVRTRRDQVRESRDKGRESRDKVHSK
jgi:hypothetical protein